MDMKQKMEKVADLLMLCNDIVYKIGEKQKEQETFTAMWELAQKNNDGPGETLYRGKIHDCMDQALDMRAEVLQLVKQIQSLK